MVALLVIMHHILLQRSPQGTLPKQNQLRQAFLFDRPTSPERSHGSAWIVLPRIQPMRLSRIAKPFDDPDYVFELKHEGDRRNVISVAEAMGRKPRFLILQTEASLPSTTDHT